MRTTRRCSTTSTSSTAAASTGSPAACSGPDGAADDVVQETFLLLWEHPDRFDPRRGTLSSYLTAASRGRALDLMRRDTARRRREDRVAA